MIPSHAKAVVIGGGAVGTSVLYHLTKFGLTDCVLLERTELTAGSTWHAAGLLPLFNMSYAVGQLHKYSIDLYQALEEETGQPVGFHRTGNLRLARTRERMDEYHTYAGTANTIGVPYEILTLDEIKSLWPLANFDGLIGAIFHPQDGHIAPADLTQALAKGAKTRGARIFTDTEVTAITRTTGGEWQLTTPKGTITAEIVVSATGNYARQMGEMVGLRLPMIPVEHQYLVTDPVPELIARKEQGLPELAVLRESDSSYYLREERQGYILGGYEPGAKACFVDGVPPEFGRSLFPGDLDRIMPLVSAVSARVPSFATATVKDIINGPIPYTPDGSPLLGKAWGLPNYYLAEGMSFGITTAGGAGWFLAELICNGTTTVDPLPVDPRRFGGYVNKHYTEKKNIEAYEHVFIVHYPLEERAAARPAKTTPSYDRFDAAGAVWGQRFGWERPNFFVTDGSERTDDWSFRRAKWYPHVKAECEACRDRVGLIDLSPFSKWEVRGSGAEPWLNQLGANTVPSKIGGIRLLHVLFENGGVRSEFTVTRLGEQFFYLVSSGAAHAYDSDLLRQSLPTDGSVELQDVTTSRGTFVLAGPESRNLLAALADCDLTKDFPWLSGRQTTVGLASDVYLLRVNFVGELGYELHHPIEYQRGLLKVIEETGQAHGLGLVGMRAMESMRLEKSYRMWGQELTKDYSPLDAGLKRFVKLDDNRRWRGKSAVLKQQAQGASKRFVTLRIDADSADCFGNEPIFANQTMVGRCTSGGYGHRLDQSLALGYIESDSQEEDLTVTIVGSSRPAVIVEESPFDPKNLRLLS